MNHNLLTTLAKKGIVQPGTEIEAKFMAPGLDGCFREEVSGIFTVSKIVFNESKKVKYLLGIRSYDEAKLIAMPNAIMRIDGMEPEDLGKAFDILPNGQMKKIKLDEHGMPVRRGRKPKIPRHETAKQLRKENNRRKKQLLNQ